MKYCAERQKKDKKQKQPLHPIQHRWSSSAKRRRCDQFISNSCYTNKKSAQCRNVTSSASPSALQTLYRAFSDKGSKQALSKKFEYFKCVNKDKTIASIQWGKKKKKTFGSHQFWKLSHLKKNNRSVMFIIGTLQLWETDCKTEKSRKSHSMIFKECICVMVQKISV